MKIIKQKTNITRTIIIIISTIIILMISQNTMAFTPISGSPLANNEHPRMHLTKNNLPLIREGIANNPILKEKYQEYINWAKDQDINSKDNTISDAGHVVLHPQMISQALIAQIGEVPGVKFPEGWTKEKYARKAIETLKTRLEEGSSLGYAAAITYDWTYEYMTPEERKDLAEMMKKARITHKKFDFTIENPNIQEPIEMFSSKYYEGSYPYYQALAISGEEQVDEALDSFYKQMLDYGYFDAIHFAGEEGGWNEWIGYASWHPKNHLLNIDAWRTATRENYITGENLRVKAKVPLGGEGKYAKFLYYAVDPHHYTAEPNSPLELDTYTFIRTGSASTTDTSLGHNEKKQELYFLAGMLYDAGLKTEAGLIRNFIDQYQVKFIEYYQHWPWAFMGAEGSNEKVTPEQINMPKYYWAKNHGTFFARTGFNKESDGVFTVNDAHFRYAGHGGADDFPGFTINKYGPLVNTRYVAHRGYGNLENYEGAFRYNVIDFGQEEKYVQLEDKADLKSYLQGNENYDLGGIIQVTPKENEFYHVRSDRSPLYNNIKHTRDYVWIPGGNPDENPDILIIYDRTRGSTTAKWNYHVPWEPEVMNYNEKIDITTGTGESDRKGTRYEGSNLILKELNGKGGEDDADEKYRGTSYTGGAGAHGVLWAKTLLPVNVKEEVTRVARLDDDVLRRQSNLAIKSGRWQVTIIPSQTSNEYHFLNVMISGEEKQLTSMPETTLITTNNFEGTKISSKTTNGKNYLVMFNKQENNYEGSITYYNDMEGTTKHIIIGLNPEKQYTITINNQKQTIKPLPTEQWEYINGTKARKTGVISFETSTPGTITITEQGALQVCEDGTPENNCALEKPYYCQGSTLIKKCDLCGCSAGEECQPTGECQAIIHNNTNNTNNTNNNTNNKESDLNKDGTVDNNDFEILNQNYGIIYYFLDLLIMGREWEGTSTTQQNNNNNNNQNNEIILQDDFEGATTTVDSFIDDTASTITTEDYHSTTHSLKMCAGNECKFSQRIMLDETGDEMYARYWFKIGNYQAWYNPDGSPKTGEHYKNPGFEGGSTNCKGGNYYGDDCATIRTRLLTPYYGIHAEGYVGIIDSVDKTINVVDGKWHCFQMRVKLNTPGQNDGEITYWIDGHENRLQGLTFRNDYSWNINKWWWTYWSNDNWLGPTYIDDLIISKSMISC